MTNILCIGMDAAPLARYARLLTESGYRIVPVTLGRNDTVRSMVGPSTELIIVECHGLSMDEYERLETIRMAAPGVTIILIADCLSVEYYLRSLALGVHDYLCIPVAEHEVLKAVQAALAKERTPREPSSGVRTAGFGLFTWTGSAPGER